MSDEAGTARTKLNARPASFIELRNKFTNARDAESLCNCCAPTSASTSVSPCDCSKWLRATPWLTGLLWHVAICLVDVTIQLISDVLFLRITTGGFVQTAQNMIVVQNWLHFPLIMAFSAFSRYLRF